MLSYYLACKKRDIKLPDYTNKDQYNKNVYRGVMLPILEELPAHESKQANEIHYCSELKPFLIKLNVRIFPIEIDPMDFSNPIKDWIQSFLAGHRNIPFLLEP